MPDSPFHGIDHVDTRVRSLAAVEPFYDKLLPPLGLPRKTHSHVDAMGDWHDVDDAHPKNVTEYHEAGVTGRAARFIGFIEAPEMTPVATRIAFAVNDPVDVQEWEPRLREIGARNVEFSEDMDLYPAVFFEDPAGTRLEICARNPAK